MEKGDDFSPEELKEADHIYMQTVYIMEIYRDQLPRDDYYLDMHPKMLAFQEKYKDNRSIYN